MRAAHISRQFRRLPLWAAAALIVGAGPVTAQDLSTPFASPPSVAAAAVSGDAFAGATAASDPGAIIVPAAQTQLPQPGEGEYLDNPFGMKLPKEFDPSTLSQVKHCDVLRHLKVPFTSRRIDAYMRPEYMLRRPAADAPFADKDQILGSESRHDLYEKGFDIYGCSNFDYLHDIHSNLSSNPLIAGPGPWHTWQGNINQVLGLDFYSRLISDTWKGGQLHVSFTMPEAANGGPIYSYGNTLNPAGLGTRQYQGYFYTDVGRSRDVNPEMQGFRIFEYWVQESYGKNNLSYIRVGAINPMITFNKSILSGLFGFWAFDEPGVIGTTPSTANGPVITVAPPGVSWEHVAGDHFVGKVMVASGYWDPTGGIDNRRGYKQYWNLHKYGLETTYELTAKFGTYSYKQGDNGKPWFVRVGGEYNSGYGLSNLYDINGGYFFLTGAPRLEYHGNAQYYGMVEGMVWRQPGSYDKGLTLFLKTKWTPYKTRGSSTKVTDIGLGYEGLFNRDNDVLFAGYAHMRVNQGVITRSENQLLCTDVPGCQVASFQGVYEVGYSAEIARYLFVDPKLYWVHYPNVRKDLGDIVSFGIEFRASF